MKKKINIIVKNNLSIIDCLKEEGYAKNKIKTYVKLGFIFVNNNKITKLPFNVKLGDIITIDDNITTTNKFKIIYEDDNYLVVD